MFVNRYPWTGKKRKSQKGEKPAVQAKQSPLHPHPLNSRSESATEYLPNLDSTPVATHSYMKALYKSSQNEHPHDRIVRQNRKRTQQDQEFQMVRVIIEKQLVNQLVPIAKKRT